MPDRPHDPPAIGEDRDDRDAGAALDDLRATVHHAADALRQLREDTRRLRSENERLRARVHQLEEDPGAGRDGTTLLLDENPDALRQRIDDFIEALDAHLGNA